MTNPSPPAPDPPGHRVTWFHPDRPVNGGTTHVAAVTTADAYRETYDATADYTPAGLKALLAAATLLYRRKGQKRATKTAQFQRVRALRTRLAEAKP